MKLRALVTGIVLSAPALTGCPGSWGFRGRIYTVRDPAARLEVLEVETTGTNVVVSEQLVPVPGATVVCEGCGEKPITIEANGQFSISLGTSYGRPTPIVLHITAPDYKPVDLDISRIGGVSEAGAPSITIVMTKAERSGP